MTGLFGPRKLNMCTRVRCLISHRDLFRLRRFLLFLIMALKVDVILVNKIRRQILQKYPESALKSTFYWNWAVLSYNNSAELVCQCIRRIPFIFWVATPFQTFAKLSEKAEEIRVVGKFCLKYTKCRLSTASVNWLTDVTVSTTITRCLWTERRRLINQYLSCCRILGRRTMQAFPICGGRNPSKDIGWEMQCLLIRYIHRGERWMWAMTVCKQNKKEQKTSKPRHTPSKCMPSPFYFYNIGVARILSRGALCPCKNDAF